MATSGDGYDDGRDGDGGIQLMLEFQWVMNIVYVCVEDDMCLCDACVFDDRGETDCLKRLP